MNDAPVLIVGGGPVGLSLALALAQHQVKSVLFELKTQLDPHSRALGILPRTLEIFRDWGVYDRFIKTGQLIDRVDLWEAGKTKPFASVDLSVFKQISSAGGVLILPQDQTEALLLDAAKATGFTEVLFEHKATGFTQNGDGVTLEVTRPDGVSQSFHGRYLVGCDGARSTVRTNLGWELEGKTYPTRMLLGDIRLRDQRDQLPWPLFASVEHGGLAGIRYQPMHWRFIATLEGSETDAAAQEPVNLDRRVHALFGPGPYECLWSNVFHIHCRTSPRFRQGRVLLAGDAGHINSPAGGQGMNSGIQDAHNLAWKLARALAGADAEALLSSYESERREVIVKTVDVYTDFLTRTVLLGPRFIRKLVPAALWALPRLGLFSVVAPKAGMLDAVYSRSPILSGRGAWIGKRAPDGEVRDPDGRAARIVDLTGPGPALILFDDGRLPGWEVTQVSRLFQDINDLQVIRLFPNDEAKTGAGYVDASGGSLWKEWAVTGGSTALLRPDGYVGWMGRRPSPDDLRNGVRQALGMETPAPV
ncbi:MAG: FAD-dependent monooxygenase [Verrucomicrobia bacterium]|nr:FAD-dependent monooxygenase [Verrucomicrobiota bacterium]